MAEAVLNDLVSKRASLKGKFKITVDSAGTGAYHEGEQADDRWVQYLYIFNCLRCVNDLS